ncbi:MAG: tRNA-dihydrouridine synthase [Patescibacteria group bacterium]|nr:tRNA-dihydrouridine synthase [Patescibacteria group bacterium]
MYNFWQKLKKPLVGLAPMDGVTDYPMRQIQVSVAKPNVLYTEFVSAEGFIRNSKAFSQKLYFQENERPIIAQIFGYTPEAFAETINQIIEMDFDGIDLNMGCPARKVLGKGGGGALIGNYKLAGKIIEKSLEATKANNPFIMANFSCLCNFRPINFSAVTLF